MAETPSTRREYEAYNRRPAPRRGPARQRKHILTPRHVFNTECGDVTARGSGVRDPLNGAVRVWTETFTEKPFRRHEGWRWEGRDRPCPGGKHRHERNTHWAAKVTTGYDRGTLDRGQGAPDTTGHLEEPTFSQLVIIQRVVEIISRNRRPLRISCVCVCVFRSLTCSVESKNSNRKKKVFIHSDTFRTKRKVVIFLIGLAKRGWQTKTSRTLTEERTRPSLLKPFVHPFIQTKPNGKEKQK